MFKILKLNIRFHSSLLYCFIFLLKQRVFFFEQVEKSSKQFKYNHIWTGSVKYILKSFIHELEKLEESKP